MSLVFANSLLLVLVLLELTVIHFHKKTPIPWREIVANLNSGHLTLWMFRGLEIAAFHLVLQYANLHLFRHWNSIVIWIVGYLAWDFCFYFMHRAHHHTKLLWAVHVVHHQGKHFGLSLGIRNSWYSSLSNFPFVIILAVLGLPLEVFITVSSINYVIQFYNHNGIIDKSGLLEKCMITPSHHRVHHGENDCYVNKNFGGTFIIWDVLFGTFQPELPEEPVRVGIKGQQMKANIFWTNNLSFLKLLNMQKRPSNSPKFFFSTRLIVSSGLLLYCYLLLYISYESSWPSHISWAYFSMVFLATLANGGMSDHKRWGAVVWIFTFSIFLPLLTLYFHFYALPFLVLGGVSLVLSLYLLYILAKKPSTFASIAS